MEHLRIRPGTDVDLASFDPNDTSGFDGGKSEAVAELKRLRKRLADLQYRFWADGGEKLLVVLQALDSGGKDGTVRRVFAGVNPQGVRVHGFKKPTEIELAHDYLWRVHRHTPASGMIAVFNRSHYEDVLVVRVLGLVPEERWRKRYGHINAFERLLTDEGTTIVKFYLHISEDEQAERFQARLDDPTKRWKFSKGDLATRSQWDAYMAAYNEALSKTSTEHAPWYVVPANKKWYRNLVVARTLIGILESMDLQFPEPEEDLDDIVIV